MRQVLCIFDSATGPKFIRSDVLDLSCLDNIRQHSMPEIQRAYDKKLVVYQASTLYLRMSGSRTLTPTGFVQAGGTSIIWKES